MVGLTQKQLDDEYLGRRRMEADRLASEALAMAVGAGIALLIGACLLAWVLIWG